eukprot:5484556-Pyramimonas_sp.AAC.2
MLQGFHGLRAAAFQKLDLAFAPRTFIINGCTGFTASHVSRRRKGVCERFRTVRARQLGGFAMLMSQEWCSSTIQDR